MIQCAVSVSSFLEDASGMRGHAEKAFAPSNVEELREIVATAAAEKIPLTVMGAATGLTGAAVAQSGWAVSLSRFRKVEVKQGLARCGVGVSLRDLEDEAAKSGQFFGPNPTEYLASIGGIISTNAGGARSFRFRSVRHHVLGLEVTFMSGETRWLKREELVNFDYTPVMQPATTKNSAGYFLPPNVDWVNLLSGSEGTLGVITEAEVGLFPIAPAILSGVVFFRSDEDALNAVDEWRPVPGLRLLEYLDYASLEFMRPLQANIPAGARAALLVEQDLRSEGDEEVDFWVDRLATHHAFAEESWFGFSAQDRETFRAFRHTLAATVVERVRHTGLPKIGTDFAVPLERSRDLLADYRRHCDAIFPRKYLIFGHIGDANVHLNILPSTPQEAKQGEEMLLHFAQYAVSLGGTVAAEHGIGKNKRDLLRLMYSADEIGAMKQVKSKLDPDWLLGRGNIFD
ncbi:MAG TPA: FAD-binding oxidoreductase [Bryobacteraceae bacterium]|nr:FAD-binding oxidoreductase [Bryobacteraceae bacterium]